MEEWCFASNTDGFKEQRWTLRYPGFSAMCESVIHVIVHFKRFRLLNSAGTSYYYKNVITCSELQVGPTSSDVWGIGRQLNPVIPATPICTLQYHRKRLRLLRCLNEGAHARAPTHTRTHTHAHRIHQFRPTNEDTSIYILTGLLSFVCCKYRQHENKIN